MKLYKLFLTLSAFSIISYVNAQNSIQNPSLEQLSSSVTGQNQISKAIGWSNGCAGNMSSSTNPPFFVPGTPDLFDADATCTTLVGIPLNKWSNLQERNGSGRYAGISGGRLRNIQGTTYKCYGESIKGTLTEPLIANCNYSISFYAAAIRGYNLYCSNYSPEYLSPDPQYNRIEVVLRNGNNCTLEKVVFISSPITSYNWSKYTGYFSLSSQDINQGYNKIEFRLKLYPLNYYSDYSHIVYLDDFSLNKIDTPLSSDFNLEGFHISGSSTYTITASVPYIPSGTSFWWEVSEIDLNSGTVVPNTTLTNPSSWWNQNLLLINTFPGYCCNSSATYGNGIFYYGHKYRITRGVWGPCSNWNTTSKTIYIGSMTSTRQIEESALIETDTTYNPVVEILQSNNIGTSMNNSNLPQVLTEQVQVFPNPFESGVTVSLPEQLYTTDVYIERYSFSGQIILKRSTLDSNFPYFDLSKYPSGMYFIKVISKNQQLISKIIKSK
jgi:hypothetical protein